MKLRLLFVLLIISLSVNAQSPYQLSYKVDAPVLGVGVGTLLTGFIMDRKSQPFTLNDLQGIDRMDVGLFDRSATYNWNTKAAHGSDALMYFSVATPLLFLAGERSRKDFGKVALISTEVFLLNTGLTFLTKELVKRKRPLLYNPNVPDSEKLKSGTAQSFFSGHTSTVSSMAFSFAMMHTHYYPDSRLKPLVWFAAAVLPMIQGILRVRAGKHFWTDVIVGYGVGASVGVLVPILHKIRE